MKIFKFTTLVFLSLMVLNAHSQALRLSGYDGLVVLTNGDSFSVNGATLDECESRFDDVVDEQIAATGYGLYYGRSGTQTCTPSFVYRSPTAPATSMSSAAALIPQLPFPPFCLSCPIFTHPDLIKDLFPDHNQLVEGYVQQFKIDQYNLELQDLQSRYKSNLTGFEQKMFALEESLINKAQ